MVVIGKNTKRNFSTTQAKYILLIIKLYFCPYLLSSFSHILSLFPKQTHLWACVLQIINTFLPIATKIGSKAKNYKLRITDYDFFTIFALI